MPEKKKLLTVDEFCQIYGVGRTRAYELIDAAAIIAVKIGVSTRITAESAEAWLKSLPPVHHHSADDEDDDGAGDEGNNDSA